MRKRAGTTYWFRFIGHLSDIYRTFIGQNEALIGLVYDPINKTKRGGNIQFMFWDFALSNDPAYPVPNLSTLALMGSGLVVGVGLLAYSNKKKK